MNRFTYDQRRGVYLKAIAKYGIGNRDHLAEEIADATIMLEQMRLVFNLNQAVCDKMDEKIERLKKKVVWE